jgi:hypothetical protein
MTGYLALAAGAVWFLALAVYLVAADASSRLSARTAAKPVLEEQRPALVNLAATRCRLDSAAYAATILDLSARGFIETTQREPGRLWCTVTRAPGPASGLTAYESVVLTTAIGMTGARGAPFEALAESCTADVRGSWDPFEEAVREEGRSSGLTGGRLPGQARALLYAGAAGAGALAYAALRPHSHGLAAPVAVAVVVFGVLAGVAMGLANQDRLTRAGAALAAAARRPIPPAPLTGPDPGSDPAARPGGGLELGRLAQAVAAGAPIPLAGALPGVQTGVRPGGWRHAAGQRRRHGAPRAAWSSLGGGWRLVQIGPTGSSLWVRVWGSFAVAGWFAVMSYPFSLIGGRVGTLIPAGLLLAAILSAAGGVRALTRALGLPRQQSFRAQVIARWAQDRGRGDDTVRVCCVALDDGQHCWTFELERAVFGTLALGDEVNVTVAPRSARLLSLELDPATAGTPGADPRPAGPPARPPGPAEEAEEAEESGLPVGVLLWPGEAAGLLGGGPVRVTKLGIRKGTMVMYRANRVTLSVAVTGALPGGTLPPRRGGQRLPGIGDEAWLTSEGQAVVARVGESFLKIRLSGRHAPAGREQLPGIAATVAARMRCR